MKVAIGKIMVFFLPFLINVRFLYIPNLDFFLASIFFAISLIFFKTEIFNYKKYKGVGLLFLIIILSTISLLRSTNNEFLTNFRLSYVLMLYSLSSIFLVFYFKNDNSILKVFFKGLIYYLFVVSIFTLISTDNNIKYFFSDPFQILSQSNRDFAIKYSFATTSNNHFAVLVVSAALFQVFRFKQDKTFFSIIVLFFLVLLLLSTRARVPIFTFLFLSIFILIDKVPNIFKLWFFLLAPLFLIVISNIESFVKINFLSNIFFSKDDLYTFNGRIYLWGAVLNDLLNFQPIHLIGFGDHGDISMHTVRMVIKSTKTTETLKMGTSHNLYLQMVTDMGYFFLMVFLVFLIRQFKILKKNVSNNKFLIFPMSILIGFLLCGSTEALWGNYLPAITILMVMIFSYVIFSASHPLVNDKKII